MRVAERADEPALDPVPEDWLGGRQFDSPVRAPETPHVSQQGQSLDWGAGVALHEQHATVIRMAFQRAPGEPGRQVVGEPSQGVTAVGQRSGQHTVRAGLLLGELPQPERS
ncbi:hypothetical protein ACFWCA_19435 [Streptomyces phaeochromogenes]|uniref:hypothetical protein n=1 Tax=Streptomyces phaeochromogenes TaxID=1923 RepID=UPI00367EFEB6